MEIWVHKGRGALEGKNRQKKHDLWCDCVPREGGREGEREGEGGRRGKMHVCKCLRSQLGAT